MDVSQDALDADTIEALKDPEFREFVEQFHWGVDINNSLGPNPWANKCLPDVLDLGCDDSGILPPIPENVEGNHLDIHRLREQCAVFPSDQKVFQLLKKQTILGGHAKGKPRDRHNEAVVKKILAKLTRKDRVNKLYAVSVDVGLSMPTPSGIIKRI